MFLYMKFEQAMEKAINEGEKIKLPQWGGYWEWNPEKKSFMMHERNGNVLDIRESNDMQYTLSGICKEKWVIATSENCDLLGGKATFDSETAAEYINRGFKLKQIGPNEWQFDNE